jgi:hypothetical protein
MKPIFEFEKLYREYTLGIVFGLGFYKGGYTERFIGIEIFLFAYHISVGFIFKA